MEVPGLGHRRVGVPLMELRRAVELSSPSRLTNTCTEGGAKTEERSLSSLTCTEGNSSEAKAAA